MRRRRMPRGLTIPEIKRADALSRAGLSDAGVAIVMNLDYGVSMTAQTARYYRLQYGMGPRPKFRADGLVGASRDSSDNFPARTVC